MPTEVVQLPVRRLSAAVAILDMPRQITAQSETLLMAALSQVRDRRTRMLILNLSALERMDSFGLGCLIVFLTRAMRQGLRLLGYGLNDEYRQVFALTHLDRAVAIHASESSACAAAQGAAVIPSSAEATPTRPVGNWAQPVARLKAPPLPPGAVNLNVDGRRTIGPLDGFGRMVRKTYSIRLNGAAVSPADLMARWKRDFASYWPKGNDFYGAQEGINPGDTAVLNLTLAGPLKLHTGVLVIYADDASFCYMTPQGHMFGGLINFSAYDDQGTTVVQVQPLIRASDPFFEVMLRLGIGGSIEDAFWRRSLENLAAACGAQSKAQQTAMTLDNKVRWSAVANIWYNAAIRTTFYTLAAPLRWLRQRSA